MKRQDDLGVGGSIALTIVFAVMAVVTYQTDSNGNPLAWIPGIMVVVGIIMTIMAANKLQTKVPRKNNSKMPRKRLNMTAVLETMI